MVQIILLAFSVSLDAFSVSITQGAYFRKSILLPALVTSFVFGIFQAIMPILGWFVGEKFKGLITGIDHWVAFTLLAIIGIKIIYKSLQNKPGNKNQLSYKNILLLAIATSLVLMPWL